MAEHDALVQAIGRLEGTVHGQTESIKDLLAEFRKHVDEDEERLRDLERTKWKGSGILIVVSALGSWIASHLL